MFHFLGRAVSRFWPLFLGAWLLLLVGSYLLAPPWDEVAQDREFAFLPPDAPSRVSQEVFGRAFPDQHANSAIVVVLYRGNDQPADVPRDKQFIQDVLEPELRQIAEAEGGLTSEAPPP